MYRLLNKPAAERDGRCGGYPSPESVEHPCGGRAVRLDVWVAWCDEHIPGSVPDSMRRELR